MAEGKGVRFFEVLGQRFELPVLELRKQLEHARKLRARLGATWFESLTAPVVERFSSEEFKTERAFLRARRVLEAHQDVVYDALDHVTVYENALTLAIRMVGEKANAKLDALAMRARERQRIAAQASRLAERVGAELETDLALIRGRMLAIGKAAHLMLTRLEARRDHVTAILAKLEERREALSDQAALLTHDEHQWYFREELRNDGDLARWQTGPDRLCESVEGVLHHLVAELEGFEARLEAMPGSVERVLARVEEVDSGVRRSGPDVQALLEVEGFESLSAVGSVRDIPQRLDDEDWNRVLKHEQDLELLSEETQVDRLEEALRNWLERAVKRRRAASRRCATCTNPLLGGQTCGRAHVMCHRCRAKARAGGMAWLSERGFAPTTRHGMRDSGLISRVVFESLMGHVPNVGEAHGPVTGVTWREAVAFCNALSVREGRAEVYRIGRVTRRRNEEGWRLPESLEDRDISKANLREWLFASTEDLRESALGPGLRLVAPRERHEVMGRAVADAQEDDIGFRCLSPIPRPVEVQRKAPAKRARPSRRKGASARRLMQLLAFAALVSLAAGLVMNEFAPSSPTIPSSDTRTASEPAPSLGEPPGEPTEPVETEKNEITQKLEAAEAARLKKDRKGALKLYESILELEPGHLEARYGAAREAAALRDGAKAFMYLEVLVANGGAEARDLLRQALTAPEFSRLVKDPRWKRIEKAATATSTK